jgi:hypothetical protein
MSIGKDRFEMNDDKKPTAADKRRLRDVDASAAMAEYKASNVADQAKTARLRALRLAKEADASGKAEKPKPAPKPSTKQDKPKRTTKRSSVAASLLGVLIARAALLG